MITVREWQSLSEPHRASERSKPIASRREAIGCSWLPRRAGRLQALAADLQSKHRANVTIFVADLEVSEDLAGLASRIGEEDMAMLINNAGAGELESTAKAWPDRNRGVTWPAESGKPTC